MKRATSLLLLTALITGCPTVGGPRPGVQPINVSGRYVHGPSRFEFPETFGAFRRVEINQFHPSGLNIGVGYNLEQADTRVAVTLYVRPPARDANGSVLTLASEFELERENILQHHPGATASVPSTPPRTQNGEAARGYATTFRYQHAVDYGREEVETLLYLFEYDGWVVKYRITYPFSQQARANPVSQGFVSSFRWRGGSAADRRQAAF